MKVIKILSFGIVLIFGSSVFGLGFFAPSAFKDVATPTSESAKSFPDKPARELWAQNCARCHGADGRGDTELGRTFDVPNIADADWQNKHSDAKIARKIARGGGGMPAFAKKLSTKEISSLTAYVRTLKK